MKIGYDNDADGDILDAGDDIQVSDNFNSAAMTLTYDDNGNLTADGVPTFVYDAWNRLRKTQRSADADTTTIATHSYVGDTRRASKVVEKCGPEAVLNDAGNTTTHFYYCGVGAIAVSAVPWSICETRNAPNEAVQQMLWGTQYIDELVFFDNNGDPTNGNDCNPDNTAQAEEHVSCIYGSDR